MFAVCVKFQISENQMADFMPLMIANAQASLTQEQGCHRFDVLTDPARPGEVFLYELYQNAAAFDAHLATGHFKSFDANTAGMIKTKDIATYADVAS